MFNVILGFLIGAGSVTWVGREYLYPKYWGVDVLMTVSMVGAIGGLLGALLAFVVGAYAPGDCVNPVEVGLVNISDGITTQGSFFIGSGYVNGNLTYFYYEQLSDGGFAGKQIPASEAEIKYTNDSSPTPKVVTYDYQLQGYWRYFGFTGQTCTTLFYVPPDSVKSNYTLGR